MDPKPESLDSLFAHKTLKNVTLPEAFIASSRAQSISSRVRFGMPSKPPDAIAPDWCAEEFTYPSIHRDDQTKRELLPKLVPPPCQPPPQGYYPVALEYRLQEDCRYASGSIYVADYPLTFCEEHRQSLLAIQTPPECTPVLMEGRYVLKPIPGMINLIPGIPFVVYIDGNPDLPQTVACFQNLSSLRWCAEYNNIEELSIRLAQLTWGRPGYDGHAVIPPVYTLKLKVNDRHQHRKTTHISKYDGSFNLGNTIMKGDGPGTIIPTVQTDLPAASAQIQAILQTLHSLYRLVLPKCISRFEYDITTFHAEYMNAFCSGGLEPAATSIQLNISSLGSSLEDAIGEVQGMWHTDVNDDPDRFTLFILLLRVGPKGHPGPFCLGRWGLYSANIDAWIVFLVFKGVDIHSGFPPVEQIDDHEAFVTDSELHAAYNMAGPPNRAGYVMYSSRVSLDRSGSLNATLPTSFGNITSSMAKSAGKIDSYLNFGSHGPATLGPPSACANRLAREVVFNFYNGLCLSDLDFDMNLSDLLSRISISGEDGKRISMEPLRYNPQEHAQNIQRLVSLYRWHSFWCHALYIRITKGEIRSRRRVLQGDNSSCDLPGRIQIGTSQPEPFSESPFSPDDVIKVISCKRFDNQTFFTIQVSSMDSPVTLNASHPSLSGRKEVIQWLQNTTSSISNQNQIPVINISSEPTFEYANMVSNIMAPSSSDTSHSADNTPPSAPIATQQSDSHKSTNPTTAANLVKNLKRPIKKLPVRAGRKTTQPTHETRGTKRPFAQSEGDLSTDLEVEPEYEVDGIERHRFNTESRKLEFLIRWKGYDDPDWQPAENLEHCIETLADYASANSLILPCFSAESLHKSKKPNLGDSTQRNVLVLAHSLKQLRTILDPKDLKCEAITLEEEYRRQQLNPAVWKGSMRSFNKVIKELDGLLSSRLVFDAYRPILAHNNPITMDLLSFNLLSQSLQELPPLKQANWTAPYIERSVQAETCIMWVSVYEWYYKYGPRLASHIMSAHREHGFQHLQRQLPLFAKLADHIVHFLVSTIQFLLKPSSIPSPISSSRSQKIMQDCTYILDRSNNAPKDSNIIPSDLYGLTGSTPRKDIDLSKYLSKPFSLGQAKRVIDDVQDYVYNVHGPKIFMEIISAHLIIPQLARFDEFTVRRQSGNRSRLEPHHIQKRAVIRGALLHCLQEICGGTSIFFTLQIKLFLSSPFSIIESTKYDRDDMKMAKAILKENEIEMHLAPLLQSIHEIISLYPDISQSVSSIHQTVLRTMNALANGHPPSDDDDGGDDDDGSEHSTNNRPSKAADLQTPNALRGYQPSADLLISESGVGLGTLGLIIREALNLKRNLPAAQHEVHRVLLGLHPTLSSNAKQPINHTNPIRASSEYACLFALNLPSHLLTTRSGLSNILSYMGTGQGSGTSSFLSMHASKPHKFFTFSLDEVVQLFQSAVTKNCAIFGTTLQANKSPAFISCFDTRIWGQPSRSFSLAPEGAEKYRGVRHKFEPYWTSSVQDQWEEFLGPNLNIDPQNFQGRRPSWLTILTFLLNLRIPGFQTGLTVFQCANNLALAGICEEPTCQEIVNWVGRNKHLGAWKGLKTLGFSIGDRSGLAVYPAFFCVWKFLDIQLSEKDKVDLGFSPMFVEHILCKITRYSKRWPDFLDCAQSAEKLETPSTISSSAKSKPTSHLDFQFPLIVSLKHVQELLLAYYSTPMPV
ncbi:hypothetical protein BJ165DRAFT_1535148 [Panaeolus papilionaceus]|nr:hypothetical protein BJ165DRAFT_1535148 [Panaeolus papilionaceus]